MATGEYVSVASQAELTRAEIEIEKAEIQPGAQGRGGRAGRDLREARASSPSSPKEVARQLSHDPEQAWRVHAREELGVDPDDLPSPWMPAGLVVRRVRARCGAARCCRTCWVPPRCSRLSLVVAALGPVRRGRRWSAGSPPAPGGTPAPVSCCSGGRAAAVTYAIGTPSGPSASACRSDTRIRWRSCNLFVICSGPGTSRVAVQHHSRPPRRKGPSSMFPVKHRACTTPPTSTTPAASPSSWTSPAASATTSSSRA